MANLNFSPYLLVIGCFFAAALSTKAQQITANGKPAKLEIRKAGEHSIRVTLKPIGYAKDFPATPAVVDKKYPAPAVSITNITGLQTKKIGNLSVDIKPSPLSITISSNNGRLVQKSCLNKMAT